MSKNQGLKNPLIVASAANSAKNYLWDNKYKILIGTGVLVGGFILYRKLTGHNNLDFSVKGDEALSKMTMVEATSKAQILFDAMKNPGHNTQLIFDTLNGLNYNDFAKTSRAFGTKYYNRILGVEGGWLFGDDKLGLFEWLNEELSTSEKRELQRIMPNVITFEQKLRAGMTVYANQTVDVYEAEQIDGVWTKGELHKTYNKNDKIGDVMLIKTDPWQSSLEYAIIDKPWSFTDLWVETKYINA